MFEDEIVSVAVALRNRANRFEILDLLEARCDARRAVTGAGRMAWHRRLRTCSKGKADNTAQHDDYVLHAIVSSESGA
jgi:hypothetical protein